MIDYSLYIREIKLKNKENIDNYIKTIKPIMDIDSLKLRSSVTFLVGENGMGKSTLLEAIAIAHGFNPEGGTINFNFSSRESHSELYKNLTLVKGIKRPSDGFFLRAESFYNVASEIDELDETNGGVPLVNSYGGKSLHKQSHGESFMSLIMNRFSGNGLYILDEPEAALSPQRQLSLLSRISDLVNNGSQFIIATHSPILMAFPGADIFVLNDEGIKLTPYKETDHYLVTKYFINNPESMLSELIKET